jgi:transcriptional regulator with XRE-family HTH domain
MISRALKLIRTYHNVKQTDLAKRLGLSPSHLSEIEKGIKPVSYDLLEKYAQVFRMPVSSITLFAEISDKDAKPGLQGIVAEKALKLLEWIDSIAAIEKQDGQHHSTSH